MYFDLSFVLKECTHCFIHEFNYVCNESATCSNKITKHGILYIHFLYIYIYMFVQLKGRCGSTHDDTRCCSSGFLLRLLALLLLGLDVSSPHDRAEVPHYVSLEFHR